MKPLPVLPAYAAVPCEQRKTCLPAKDHLPLPYAATHTVPLRVCRKVHSTPDSWVIYHPCVARQPLSREATHLLSGRPSGQLHNNGVSIIIIMMKCMPVTLGFFIQTGWVDNDNGVQV